MEHLNQAPEPRRKLIQSPRSASEHTLARDQYVEVPVGPSGPDVDEQEVEKGTEKVVN